MFNNIKWNPMCNNKHICHVEKVLSLSISIISILIEVFSLMVRIFNVNVACFVFAIISILLLPYVGEKVDLSRGYE